MKNKLIYLLFTFVLLFSACDKDDDIEYTSAGIMGGEWCVTIDGSEDVFTMRTSNTASDKAGELLLRDDADFWDFIVTVSNDLNTLTFSTVDAGVKNQVLKDEVADKKDYNEDGDKNDLVPYDILVKVKGGLITQKSVKLPSGVMADKIEFTVAFEDDDNAFTEHKIIGYRITGFEEDEGFAYKE